MEKKNRKNRKPLIVVAMLLMVALVVGLGAMTYSRYVSSFNSGTQQATAAKWGFPGDPPCLQQAADECPGFCGAFAFPADPHPQKYQDRSSVDPG